MSTTNHHGCGRFPLRPRTDPDLADAQHVPGRAGLDHRGDRGAVDRQRPRRFRRVPLAVLGVPARAGGLGARLRQAGRHLRPQADHAVRHRAVPARIDPVRICLEHAGADRVPRRAGPRRRRRPADEHHHRRRYLHARRAGQGAGLSGQCLGDLRGGRPHPGRAVRAVPDLALDLPGEHPAVRAGRLDADAQIHTNRSSGSVTRSTTWAAPA